MRPNVGWWPWITGFCVFASGFGALLLFWEFGTYPPDLPGLWAYRSATIGDGILLPIAAGLLVAARLQLPPARHDRRVTTVAAIVGALAGVSLQVSWYVDPAPQRNWTLPGPHTFSMPGYYHAGLVVAGASYFAALIISVLWRYRQYQCQVATQPRRVADSPAASLLVASLLGFATLVVQDNDVLSHTLSTRATLCAIVVAVMLGGIALVIGVSRRRATAWGTLIWAAGGSLGICLIGWQFQNIKSEVRLPYFAVILAGSMATVIQLWQESGPFRWLRAAVIISLMLAGVSQSLALMSSAPIEGLLVMLGTMVVSTLMLRQPAGRRKEAITLGAALTFMFVMLVADAWVQKTTEGRSQLGSFVWSLIAGALTVWLLPVIKLRYGRLVDDEKRLQPGVQLVKQFWTAWLTLIVLVVGVAIGILQLLHTTGVLARMDPPHNSPTVARASIGPIAVLAAGMALLACRISRNRMPQAVPKWTDNAPLQIRWWSMVGSVAATVAWGVGPWVTVDESSLSLLENLSTVRDYRSAVILGLIMAIWSGYIAVESLRGNLATQEFYRLGRRGWAVCLTWGLAVSSVVFWLFVIGVWETGGWANALSVICATALVYFGNAVIASILAWTLARSMPGYQTSPGYLTLHHPSCNVFQDHLAHGFALVATVLAVVGIAKMTARIDPHEVNELWVMAKEVFVPFVIVLLVSFLLTKANTTVHLSQERQLIEKELGTGIRRRITPTMVEFSNLVGHDLSNEIRSLNNERLARIERRLTRTHFVTFVMSPFGWLPLLSVFAWKHMRPRVLRWWEREQ